MKGAGSDKMQPCSIISLSSNVSTEWSIVVWLLCQYVSMLPITTNVRQLKSLSYSEVIECLPFGITPLSFQSHGRSGDEPRGGPWEVSRRHVHPTESAGPTNVKENGIKCKYIWCTRYFKILFCSIVFKIVWRLLLEKREILNLTCILTHNWGKNTKN